MAQDPEKMKSLIAFKKRLEDQLERMDVEMKEIQAALDTVNSILLEKGFKRGDLKEVPQQAAPMPEPKEVFLPKQEPPTVVVQHAPAASATHAPTAEHESVIPLRTMADEPLAVVYLENQVMRVMPDSTKNFSVNTPPFTNFLVEKVLAKMQEKDAELVRARQLPADQAFAFNVAREGDLIREITIRNVDEERLKELKSSIRWTFEKMYEKMKGN
jgi:hypothetical protein